MCNLCRLVERQHHAERLLEVLFVFKLITWQSYKDACDRVQKGGSSYFS